MAIDMRDFSDETRAKVQRVADERFKGDTETALYFLVGLGAEICERVEAGE